MRGGDREAEFREYLLADRTRLMRTALLLTAGDVHTAEDLVQTACTRVYVHWHRIKHEGAGPYAHRILVNAFLDERRRAGRHPEVVTAETLEPRLTDVPDQTDTLAIRDALLDLAPRGDLEAPPTDRVVAAPGDRPERGPSGRRGRPLSP